MIVSWIITNEMEILSTLFNIMQVWKIVIYSSTTFESNKKMKSYESFLSFLLVSYTMKFNFQIFKLADLSKITHWSQNRSSRSYFLYSFELLYQRKMKYFLMLLEFFLLLTMILKNWRFSLIFNLLLIYFKTFLVYEAKFLLHKFLLFLTLMV